MEEVLDADDEDCVVELSESPKVDFAFPKVDGEDERPIMYPFLFDEEGKRKVEFK